MFLGQVCRIKFSQFHHDLQAEPLGVAQGCQSFLDQVTGIAGQLSQVSHQTKGHQVQKLVCVLRATPTGEHLFCQFISHTGSGKGCQRVVGG